MTDFELTRVSTELAVRGYTLTSFEQLDLRFDVDLATTLCLAAADGEFSPSAAELTKRIAKNKMTMVQDQDALDLGRLLVRPVVERLFAGDTRALEGWDLYAMNRYEEGGELGAHQDTVEKTVLVVTISGQRNFDVYRKEPEYEVFRQIEQSFLLSAGSIMILDGEADPGHGVQCVKGPSVSAVLDVPALLRP